MQAKLGLTPNMMRTMANSPVVLEAYLNFNNTLAGGSLSAKLREQIALAVAETNGCEYCLSAHTAIGEMVGLGRDEILSSRQSVSTDKKVDAALRFAKTIVAHSGDVPDDDVKRVREAGYSEGEISEIIANVALNVFTNYFNQVAQTEIDFPRVALSSAA
ncbi:MAG: carboxymuconolactone decarboxylase family protein [Thermodesulfobacteriota bacterium]